MRKKIFYMSFPEGEPLISRDPKDLPPGEKLFRLAIGTKGYGILRPLTEEEERKIEEN